MDGATAGRPIQLPEGSACTQAMTRERDGHPGLQRQV